MVKIKLGIFFLFSCFYLQAQILVVKISANGWIEPILDKDIEQYNQQIVEILLKYTWPTCIAHDLTDAEKIELLSSDKPGAELDFVRKKIKAISKDLDVIFVPTTLYELFVITMINFEKLSTFSQNPDLFNIFSLNISKNVFTNIKQWIGSIVYSLSDAERVKQEINKEYNKFNDKIFGTLFQGLSILNFHKMFIQYLQEQFFMDFFLLKIDKIHNILSAKRYNIMEKFLNKIKSQETFKLAVTIDASDQLNIIKKSIDLDYQAFEGNKALLYRGSDFLNIPSVYGRKKILATTVLGATSDTSFQKIISINPYSLSFGNSLFAGCYNDSGACAYYYLKRIKDMGYAILINKLGYIDNYNSNLFFIAPLATEVGLLGSGEWFHSRSKPVVVVKSDKPIQVRGVSGPAILDTYGIFLVVRNPYKQAQLFSEYLVKNGVILHKGDYKDLTEEEKKGLTELIKQQQEIGIEYKIIAWFKKLEQNFKKRFLDRTNKKIYSQHQLN